MFKFTPFSLGIDARDACHDIIEGRIFSLSVYLNERSRRKGRVKGCFHIVEELCARVLAMDNQVEGPTTGRVHSRLPLVQLAYIRWHTSPLSSVKEEEALIDSTCFLLSRFSILFRMFGDRII